MNNTIINVDYYDVAKTGLKVVRVGFNDEYTKVDLGFLYSDERENILKITDKIYLSDHTKKKKLIECNGVNLDEEIKLKSVKDFRYFSLKFEAFNEQKDKLMLVQSNSNGTKIAIIAIQLPKKAE